MKRALTHVLAGVLITATLTVLAPGAGALLSPIYVVSDSTETLGPQFEWVEPEPSTAHRLDGASGELLVPLGFPFPVNGATTTHVYLSACPYLSFPGTKASLEALAGCDTGDEVNYGHALVHGIPAFVATYDGDDQEMSVVLYPTGMIDLQIEDMDDGADISLELSPGPDVEYVDNSQARLQGLAVRFAPLTNPFVVDEVPNLENGVEVMVPGMGAEVEAPEELEPCLVLFCLDATALIEPLVPAGASVHTEETTLGLAGPGTTWMGSQDIEVQGVTLTLYPDGWAAPLNLPELEDAQVGGVTLGYTVDGQTDEATVRPADLSP